MYYALESICFQYVLLCLPDCTKAVAAKYKLEEQIN